MPGALTLIGSGEVAAGMAALHRDLLHALPEPPRPAFLETPAGFELGLPAIAQRFSDYFERRFGLTLAMAPYHHRQDPPQAVGRALSALANANYILAGPGSPTYAAQQLRGSPVLDLLAERWRAGAQLVFASSAAIAIGRHSLPVYEIYKVGQDPHWAEGLDLLGPFGYELAIIPHWNNAEGGSHDTRACFMGLERFERLRRRLPASAVVLGVDEHTACTLDLGGGTARVRGRGGVTVLRGEERLEVPAGQSFPLSELRPAQGEAAPDSPTPAEGAAPSLADAAARIAGGDPAEGLRLAARRAPHDLAGLLHQAADAIEQAPAGDHDPGPLVEALIEARAGLRAAQQWELADRLRQRLAGLGIELRDSPEGTTWARTE